MPIFILNILNKVIFVLQQHFFVFLNIFIHNLLPQGEEQMDFKKKIPKDSTLVTRVEASLKVCCQKGGSFLQHNWKTGWQFVATLWETK